MSSRDCSGKFVMVSLNTAHTHTVTDTRTAGISPSARTRKTSSGCKASPWRCATPSSSQSRTYASASGVEHIVPGLRASSERRVLDGSQQRSRAPSPVRWSCRTAVPRGPPSI
ncbi:hypothetical protein K466DRAFT_589066 [Polyporus arcularius HHB13444]|uniref:Uncharacterized protein n=1 Tax=Polyporus arcularius HHB13444 TaxID=1314778 RepID=A0A5C3P3P1_9APHY|nr:hypothetical protein K466DRAFT_589066 [Polyporus arcularius HHB13444]